LSQFLFKCVHNIFTQSVNCNNARERGKEWKHVKVIKTGKNNYLIECNFCDKQFWVGSGNRIRAHLGVETIAGVSKCEKVPDTVIATFMKAEEKKMCEKVEMTRKRALDIATSDKTVFASTSAASDPKQPKITTIVDNQKKSEVDESVARMCYSTGVSFNILNNKHFKEMCTKIGQYGPSYKVPSDYPIRTTLLEKEYTAIARRVDQFHADNLSRTGGTIVSDGWSDAQRRPLLNFLLVTPAG
jgi:hypothetical protein